MTQFASARFWEPTTVSPRIFALADKQLALLKANPSHPSVPFKKVGTYWSACVNAGLRALAVESDGDFVWFWIGDHREYDQMTRKG